MSKEEKNKILENAEKSFESIKQILLNLKPLQSRFKSSGEKNFFFELNTFVKTELIKIEKIKHHLENNVEWSQLNVAFFGETNAGKSSTIESILSHFSKPTKGLTIGDGSKDFTKDVIHHHFETDGKKIGLIDLPGIEGDEKGNLDNIDVILKKGVTKAHIVFYVYGNSKKPEPATVKKIKKYLNEQAIVFSICNNRGKAHQYKRVLKKKGEVFIEKTEVNLQAEEILTNVLGKLYQGDLSINSLAAYLSVGHIEREDFKRDKIAFLEVFETKNKLKSFSKIDTIIEVIEQKTKHIEQVIIDINKTKLNHVLDQISSNLEGFQNSKISERKIEETKEEINVFLKKVKGEILKSEINSKNNISNKVDYHFRNIENKIIELINKGKVNKEVVGEIVKESSTILEKTINSSFKESSKNCLKKIENLLNQLKRNSKFNIGRVYFNQQKIDIFELDGLSELDVNVKDFGSFLLTFTPLLFSTGPPGWIAAGIGFAGWGISKLIGDGGKGKAISKISKELKVERNKLKEELKIKLKDKNNLFEKKLLKQLNPMKKIPKEMFVWKDRLENAKKTIEKFTII